MHTDTIFTPCDLVLNFQTSTRNTISMLTADKRALQTSSN